MAVGHQSLVFSSVFPTSSQAYTTPTPLATPDLGFTAPGQSFGGPFSSPQHTGQLSAAQRQIKRNIAWSTATRFLSLAGYTGDSGGRGRGLEPSRSADVSETLQYLLFGDWASSVGDEEHSLVDWYINEVRKHFGSVVQPNLQAEWKTPVDCKDAWRKLEDLAKTLTAAQELYLDPLTNHLLPIIRNNESKTAAKAQQGRDQSQAVRTSSKFLRDLHALFVHALPAQRLCDTLSYVFYDAACVLFRLQPPTSLGTEKTTAHRIDLHRRLVHLLQALQRVGLGGEQAQRSFAHAMDKLMSQFIASEYVKVDWYGRSSVTGRLRQWVEDGFAPFVKEVSGCLMVEEGAGYELDAREVQQWEDMAVGRLGKARVADLFDYIVRWDRSLGAILDLKEYITTPAARSHLTTSFSQQLSRRLLHAGATTTHILDVYIYIIRAFTELDAKGVLLDRVARPIRRYLREREDTARIIVASLLADVEDENGNPLDPGGDISLEIAHEMLNPIVATNEHDQDMDWGNMSWTPDPVDAGPEYKKSKSDVMAFLLSLYDPVDFSNELKNILGEHLLKNEGSDFEKEIRLLELFKLRLGDDKLQACEVMLRDVQDSRRINAAIHNSLRLLPNQRHNRSLTDDALPDITLNAQILSSFFWPALREDAFRVPAPIAALQQQYGRSFEAVKDMRKLHWLPALGRVTVELELADRRVEVECLPWQASVIHAFQGGGDGGAAAELGVQALEETLEMDEALLRNALTFWVARMVLRESAPDTYAVIERLATGAGAARAARDVEAAAAEAEAAAVSAVSAVRTQEDLLMQNMEVYRQFVVGMLTAQGSMRAERILMMLKMALPGGFQFGLEEVGMVLGRLVDEGRLVAAPGGAFGVSKG